MKKYKTCLINIKTILDKKQQKYHKIRKNSYFYFPKLYKIFILYNCYHSLLCYHIVFNST